VLAAGLTVIEELTVPVLHENVETPTPEAVSVFEMPEHIVGLETLIGDTVGDAWIETEVTAVPVPQAFVPVTV
jgi:hypothetical protein